MATKSTAVERARVAEPGMLVLLCLAAWVVPGAGHLWMGRRQKGIIFPFDWTEPLVGLAAVANLGAGAPWLLARMVDAGAGTVTAVTYEYGNCFLIVSGLLNSLVILDAFDIGMGRK